MEKETITEEQKEKEVYQEILKDSTKTHEMINDPESFKRFNELFFGKININVGKCRVKDCSKNFLKRKGVEFCSLDCDNRYYKIIIK